MPTWPSRSDLRKLARWFAGSERPRNRPEPVPSWGFIVWSDRGELRARRAPDDYPDAIVEDDREFRLHPTDMLFWGALRSPGGRFVGFDVHYVKDRSILDSPLVTRTRGVRIDHGALILLLGEAEDWECETVEGFPVEFYGDARGDFLLWFGGMECWVGSPDSVAFAMLD